MSKSLGNFEPLSSLLQRHDAQAIRLLFLMTGYRKPMNFTEDSIAGATTALRRLYDAYDALREAPPNGRAGGSERLAAQRERLYAALDDDMNTAGAAAVLFDVAAAADEYIGEGGAAEAAAFLHEAMGVLGISPNERTLAARVVHHVVTTLPALGAVAEGHVVRGETLVPGRLAPDFVARLGALLDGTVDLSGLSPSDAIQAVVVRRVAAKQEKDFALADRLRSALSSAGITLTDAKDGTTWSVAG